MPIISGLITEITTSFAEGGIARADRSPATTTSSPMTLGKRSQSWKKAPDSDVVSELANENNLAADIEPTKEKHDQIEQNQESDFEFLKKLAERNHFEFYVDVDADAALRQAARQGRRRRRR